MGRMWRTAGIGVVAVGLAAGMFLLGRHTSDTDGAHSRGYAVGYASGMRHGEARGLREGRAFQVAEPLPQQAKAAARAEFNSGYAAGANDVFSGYDGGWYTSLPYLITLTRGGDGITYDISSRTMMVAGVDYFRCPHAKSVCHRRHR